MFRFEQNFYLYALMLLPVLAVFFWLAWSARKKALAKFGALPLVDRLMPDASNRKHILKFILIILALAVLIIGWANPQWGTKREKIKRKSVDVFLALDISQSMMAEDISPTRLDRAKRFAQDLVRALRGERIGLVIFAGNAYLQIPLTTDYAVIELFLRSVHPGLAPNQGTAIADAVDIVESSFDPDNQSHKAMVLITDGENHDDEALQSVKTAHRNGLLVFSVGVGTPEGSFIPTVVNGRVDYKRDETGNPVRSRLNGEVLQNLAAAGDGAYFNLLGGTDQVVAALQVRIDQMEKRELEQRVFTEYESYFQYFIGFGLLLLVLEFVISYQKNKWVDDADLFKS